MRVKRILLLVATAILLTGCVATTPQAEPVDYSELAHDALAARPGVQAAELTQEPIEGESDPDLAEPADWVVTLSVTMDDTATADQVAQVADAALAFCEQYAVPDQWTAAIGFELIDTEPDDDLPAPDRSGFPVYPEGVDARDFMAVRGAPGVRSVLFGSGFPLVTVAEASNLPAVQQLLVGMPLWQEGGTLWAENGRVRLTELPESLTPAGYAMIIAASTAYPAAQFWLEAPTTGHGWPQLFVDQVALDEAPGVGLALSGPANAAPYDVNYFIRAIGPDGPVDSAGVLGTS